MKNHDRHAFLLLRIGVVLIMGMNLGLAQNLAAIWEGNRGLVMSKTLRSEEETPAGEWRWILYLGCVPSPQIEEIHHADAPFLLGKSGETVFAKVPFLKDQDQGPKWANGWDHRQLFAFDERSVFDGANWTPDGGNLFSFEGGKVQLHIQKAQAIAREQFRLPAKAIYLGFVRGKYFYWVASKQHRIFFFDEIGPSRRTWSLDLPKTVIEPIGISNGDPTGTWALLATCKPTFNYVMPKVIHWVVLQAKDAKPVP